MKPPPREAEVVGAVGGVRVLAIEVGAKVDLLDGVDDPRKVVGLEPLEASPQAVEAIDVALDHSLFVPSKTRVAQPLAVVLAEVEALADAAEAAVDEHLWKLQRDLGTLADGAVVEDEDDDPLTLQLLRKGEDDLLHELVGVLGASAEPEVVEL